MLALCKHGTRGASSRVRTYQYIPHLQRVGIDVHPEALFPDAYLDRRYAGAKPRLRGLTTNYSRRIAAVTRAKRFDLVWLEKELAPFIPGILERLLLARVPYVLDLDDAIFHAYDKSSHKIVRAVYSQKIDQLMRRSKLVVAGNRYLAERASNAGASVAVIPSSVDLDHYGPVSASSHTPFTIGWIGSPSSQGRLDLIRQPLEAELAQGSRMTLVGATNEALAWLDVERRPWSEAGEVEDIASFSVGIMPLDDTPWRRGKCGYKLIQYMAAGRPVIASPVGANVEIVDSGPAGLLASCPEDWSDAFEQLRHSPELGATFGARGRAVVEAKYSVQANAPRLGALIEAAASR